MFYMIKFGLLYFYLIFFNNFPHKYFSMRSYLEIALYAGHEGGTRHGETEIVFVMLRQ